MVTYFDRGKRSRTQRHVALRHHFRQDDTRPPNPLPAVSAGNAVSPTATERGLVQVELEPQIRFRGGTFDGCRVLLLCRVTLGNVRVSHRYHRSENYNGNHSTLGMASYREFIVSSPEQVYPNYILYYKRV